MGVVPVSRVPVRERGKRFTVSDSCWLVALTEKSVKSATKSLNWLRTVLASRGITTVILEDHLAAICQERAAGVARHIEPTGARLLDPFA